MHRNDRRNLEVGQRCLLQFKPRSPCDVQDVQLCSAGTDLFLDHIAQPLKGLVGLGISPCESLVLWCHRFSLALAVEATLA